MITGSDLPVQQLDRKRKRKKRDQAFGRRCPGLLFVWDKHNRGEGRDCSVGTREAWMGSIAGRGGGEGT